MNSREQEKALRQSLLVHGLLGHVYGGEPHRRGRFKAGQRAAAKARTSATNRRLHPRG